MIAGAPIRKPSGRRRRARSRGQSRRSAFSTPEAGVYGRWFPDARCNACFNALDRHVEAGRGDAIALYYDSPVTATRRAITYRELWTRRRRSAPYSTISGSRRATGC